MNTRALNFSKGQVSHHLFRGLEEGLKEALLKTPHLLPVYCEADHNDWLSASPSRALCLGTPQLRRRALLSALDGVSLFLLPPSFILLLNPAGLLGSPYLGQRFAVNGVLPAAVLLARHGQSSSTRPPSIFSPHLTEQHFFFFTPMRLFLTPCAFSLPDFHPISESTWLARQFHRISHAKRDPREEEGLLCCSAHSARSPSEALI